MIDPQYPDYTNTPVSPRRPIFNYAPVDSSCDPYVTIVTPFYNTGSVFHETAQSVLRQSFQQWEWLIVNNGSTDPDALAVLAAYRHRDPRIRVIESLDRGLSATRNLGCRSARTSYLVELDSDDMLESTAIEKWLWFLETHPEFGFVKGYTVGFGEKEYLWTEGFHRGKDFLSENLVCRTSMVRLQVDQAVGGYDDSSRSGFVDWDFWLRCANAGYWGDTIPEYLDWYRRPKTHTARWLDLDESGRNGFVDRLHCDYPRLWAGQFPHPERRHLMPWENIPEQLPFHNHLAKDHPRLLIIMPWLEMGGADKFSLDLLRQLTQRGWQVTIATTLDGDHPWLAEFARFTPDIFILHDFLPLADYPRFLRYLIDSRQVDTVLISHSYFGYMLLPYLRAFCPNVAYVDYLHIVDETWKSGGYPRASLDHAGELDLTVVSSFHLKNWMVEHGGASERIEVCTINIDVDDWDPERFDRSALRGELGIEPDVPVILYGARLTEQKRPRLFAEVMLDLVRRRCQFVCLVAGDGEDRPFLEQFLASNQLNCVRMLGEVSIKRMHELMAVSDIFFLPSRMEGISLAVYEAMAMRVVPVSADVGGQRELVTSECGILVSQGPDERATYVQTLEALFQDRDRRIEMGRAARQRVCENFQIEKMGDRMTRLIQRAHALARKKPRPKIPPDLAREIAKLVVEHTRLEQVSEADYRYWKQSEQTLRNQIDQFESSRAQLESQLTGREKAIEALNGKLGAQEALVGRLKETLTEREQAMQVLNGKLGEREMLAARLKDTLTEREQAMQVLNGKLGEREMLAARLKETLTKREQTLQDLSVRYSTLETRLAQVQLQLQTILNTKSYRFTRPISRLYGLALRALARDAAASKPAAQPVAESVPVRQKAWHRNRPLVSVIIPCYNYGRYIESAIDSVLRQTFQNLEIIVVDDGSNDPKTIALFQKLAKPKTRVLRQANRGLPGARNAGIRHAKGKYVCCLDADDTLEPTYLEKAISLLESTPGAALAYSWVQLFGDEQTIWRTEPFDLEKLLSYNHISVAAVFSRAAWKQVGGYCEEMRQGYEDWEFWINLGTRGLHGNLIPEALFNHRRHGRTMTHTAHALQEEITTFIRKKHQALYANPALVAEITGCYHEGLVDRPFLNVSKPEHFRFLTSKPSLLVMVPWLTAGGAEVLLYQVLNSLKAQAQIEFHICTSRSNENEWHDRFYALTPNIYHLPNFLPKYAWEDFLINFIHTRNIQVLLLSGSEFGYNLLSSWKAASPSLRVMNWLHNDSEWGYLRYSLQTDQFIDRHIAVHDRIAAKLQNEGNTSAAKISTICNGVDIDRRFNPELYQADALKQQRQIPPNKKVITFIGRMDAEKQPDHFLELVSKLISREDTFFVFVGRGPLQNSMEEKIKRLEPGDRLRWYKGLPPEEIPEVLAVSDLLVITSATEGMPLTALEALAMNVPVVSYDVGGVRSIIEEGANGFLIVPGHLDLLCDQVTEIILDRNLLEKLKRQARPSLIQKGYTQERMLEQYRQVFSSEFELARQAVV